MKRINVYRISVAILLVINGVLLFFLLQGPPPHRVGFEGEDIKVRISETLNLDEAQREEYFRSAKEHREQMIAFNKEQKELLNQYFGNLSNSEPNESQQNEILKNLEELEGEKISATYTHFEELKELCGPGQRAQFNEVLADMLKVIIGSDGKMRTSKNHPPRP